MATTYFIDYATGSDSNSGMSKSGPWKTAPGMANQGSRTYTHSAGDRFIFRGGVTWPKAVGTWNISNSGSSTVKDYYGVDTTWFTNGLSWVQPLIDFEKATTTGGYGIFVTGLNVNIDNLHLKNYLSPGWFGAGELVIQNGDPTPSVKITNCYFQDTQHPGGAATNSTDVQCVGCTAEVSYCTFEDSGTLINGQVGNNCAIRNIPYVDHCRIFNVCNAILGGGVIHDCDIGPVPKAYDSAGDVHCNAIEVFSPSIIFNCLIHDTVGQATPLAFVPDAIWPNGDGATSRVYNCVFWNNSTQAIAGADSQTGHPYNYSFEFLNNTIVSPGQPCIKTNLIARGAGYSFKNVRIQNNHLITPNPGTAIDIGATTGTVINDHNLIQTPSQASAAGFALATLFAPQDVGAPTVNAGANLSSIFTIDRLGAARGQGGAWDIGAYEFGGTPPNPGDSTAPIVAMTAPANGATLTGSTTLSATATDTVGVTAVTFYLDSSPIATLTSPTSGSTFSTALDTTLLANGAHTIRADARDAAGNVGSASVSVTVANGSSGGGSPGPNVLANPGFETGPFDVASTVSGWTVTGRVKDSNEGGSVGGTGHGAQFGYGGNTQGNILEQTFPTVIGKQYTFSFQAGVFGQPTATSQLRAMIIGGTTLLNSVVTPPVSNSFTPSATPFQLYSFTFTANSTSTIVRFTDIGTGNASADVILDNVSITTDAPAAGPAILHVAPPSIDWSYIGVNDSPDDETVTITNQGETDLTGTATVDVGMFSIVGSADYTIAPGATQDITLRYRPTVKGLHTATVTLTGGGGGSVALRGACYPVAGSLTGFQAEDALILSPFVAAAGKVSQPLETTTPLFGGVLVVGFDIVSADLYTVQAMVACTTDSTNSFFVQDDAEPTDPADIWDVPVTTGTELRTVGARGTGAFNDPEKPIRTFDWGVGRHFIVIRGREQNAAIDSLSIVAVAPPAAPPATPSTPSPANSATSVATTLSAITWTGDGTTYDVKFGTTSPPTQVASGLTSASYTMPAALAYDTDYFWQIVAHGPGGMTSSLVFTFHTIAAPPVIDPPSNPIPADAATSVSLTPSLRWDASPGTFVVKLGTAATPVTVVGTVTSRQFDVSVALTPDTVYYWQVNSGPIWSFRTVTVAPPKKVPAILFVIRS